MNIVEEGDTIVNCESTPLTVLSIIAGTYGLLCLCRLPSGYTGNAYLPYELPSLDDDIRDWYGWWAYSYCTLPNDSRVGVVEFQRGDNRARTIEEYDKEWERTLETMRLEQMSGTHTPDNTLQFRPFTEQSRPDVL